MVAAVGVRGSSGRRRRRRAPELGFREGRVFLGSENSGENSDDV